MATAAETASGRAAKSRAGAPVIPSAEMTLWTWGKYAVWMPRDAPPEVVAEAMRLTEERLSKEVTEDSSRHGGEKQNE